MEISPSTPESSESTSSASISEHFDGIVMIGVDYQENENDSYFWHFVRAFSGAGHNVLPVRNKGITIRSARRIYTPHIQLGSWMPRSLFGFLKSFLYFLRTVYTALWVCYELFGTNSDSKRIIAISDASFVALPILKILGGFKVVSMEYYKELHSEIDVYKAEDSFIERCISPLKIYCLSFADKILIPCPNARKFPPLNSINMDSHVKVIYAPVKGLYRTHYDIRLSNQFGERFERRSLRQRIALLKSRMQFRFVAMDILEPSCNFHQLIEAFIDATRQMSPAYQSLVGLDLFGFVYTSKQKNYRRKIYRQIKEAQAQTCARIELHSNVDFEERCKIHRDALAVLNANSTAKYIPTIIETLYYSGLIVTVNSEFISHMIGDSERGIVLGQDEPISVSFSRHILNILSYDEKAYYIWARKGAKYYKKYCSYERMSKSVRLLIASLNPSEENL